PRPYLPSVEQLFRHVALAGMFRRPPSQVLRFRPGPLPPGQTQLFNLAIPSCRQTVVHAVQTLFAGTRAVRPKPKEVIRGLRDFVGAERTAAVVQRRGSV